MSSRLPTFIPILEENRGTPEEIGKTIEALIPWRRVTDTACVITVPEHVDAVFTALSRDNHLGRMRILPGVKGKPLFWRENYTKLDGRNPWARFAEAVLHAKGICDVDVALVEMETCLRPLISNELWFTYGLNCMGAHLEALPGQILWYPSVASPNQYVRLLQRRIMDVVGLHLRGRVLFVNNTLDRPANIDNDELEPVRQWLTYALA